MAPQNSTLINLINDDIKSITTSERLSPIARPESDSSGGGSDDESECTEEIPIYINQVPRFVSGVNRRTTCNDIIKALIDDELANTKASKQLICDPQHYTIYERFQDIEHALDGEELIYELWLNWGDKRHDVQFRLKINKEFESERVTSDGDCRAKAKKIRQNGIKKLLKKVLRQGEMIQKRLVEMTEKELLQYEQYSDFEVMPCDEMSSLPSCSKWTDNAMVTDNEDDELFLVIENHNDNDSGVWCKEQRVFHEVEVDECKHIVHTPKRKFRRGRDFESLKDHALTTICTQDHFARASCKFEMVHKELKSEMNDVKEIIDREQSFLTKINRRCSMDEKRFFYSDDNFEFVNNETEFCDNNETVIV